MAELQGWPTSQILLYTYTHIPVYMYKYTVCTLRGRVRWESIVQIYYRLYDTTRNTTRTIVCRGALDQSVKWLSSGMDKGKIVFESRDRQTDRHLSSSVPPDCLRPTYIIFNFPYL